MEIYVDNLLVKSWSTRDHIADLQETFDALHRYKMKLNPSKYAFGVASDKFLGFMVSSRGIESNSEKIQMIQEMTSLNSIKKV